MDPAHPTQATETAGHDAGAGPHGGPAFRFGHMRSLDGLRGVAILLVLALHANIPYAEGGFLGVDVFFVLSGFLITSLLLQEWEHTGAISFQKFYMRRALRLLPALVAFLATVAACASLLLPANEASETRRAALYALLYVGNWAHAYHFVDLGLIYHTWSLSVEEQFYLLWPLLLRALLTLRLRSWQLICALGALAAASAIERAVLWDGLLSSNRLYIGLDTRADSLLAGCIVAVMAASDLLPKTRLQHVVARYAFVVALVVFGGIAARFEWIHGEMYRWGFAAAALCISVLLVYLLSAPPGIVARLLELSALVWIGRVSYGLYLWHFPVDRLIGRLALDWRLALCSKIGLTFAIAALSYYAIELPFLRLKGRFQALSSKRRA